MLEAKDAEGTTKILEVASRLFAERGYSNVSIRDICKLAGTTAPTIYYYFGDKRGLFNAAVQPRITLSEFIARIRKQTRNRGPTEAITNFIDTYLSSFPERAFDPGLYMMENATLEKDSAERISRELDEIQRLATEIVREGVKKGDFSTKDAERAAECLIGMLNHIVFQKIHFSRSRDRLATGSFITDFFLRALR
jgi:AcrR family transcriptional regulator